MIRILISGLYKNPIPISYLLKGGRIQSYPIELEGREEKRNGRDSFIHNDWNYDYGLWIMDYDYDW